MPNPQRLKTDLQFLFTLVLDMQDHGRRLMAPFIEQNIRVGIDNENKSSERIRIVNDEERSILLLTWNAIVYVQEHVGDADILKGSELPKLIKIKESLQKLESFGHFLSVHLESAWHLPVQIEPVEFSKGLVGYVPPGPVELVDSAISLQLKDANGQHNILYGPFLQEDIQKNSLRPFDKMPPSELLNNPWGLLIVYSHDVKVSDPSLIHLKKLLDYERQFNDFILDRVRNGGDN